MKILPKIFYILAGLCMIYFLVIIMYSGVGTAYCIVWPLFAVYFSLMGWFAGNRERSEGSMPRFLPTFIFTSFGLFTAVFVLLMTLIIQVGRTEDPSEPVDYVIVLGARVYSDGVSKTLMYRMEQGEAYYREHPETTFVLSGGQDSGDPLPEALAMYSYFYRKGIPAHQLLLNTMGITTVSVIAGAIDEIEVDTDTRKTPKGPGDPHWKADYVPSVGIITSDYHMFRALRVAQNQGIAEPYAIPAKSDRVLFIHQCVRECAALIKDYLMGNFTLNERELSFTGIRVH